MAEIETTRDDIKALEGVHLFHYGLSANSQRVRVALEEKGVDWESHLVDLRAGEHATPEFQALNPNGVVPVLVHDGRTFVESNEIIDYINDSFPGPSLQPSDPADRAFVEATIEHASAVQGSVKLLSYEFLFKRGRRMNPEQLAEFEKACNQPALVEFMRELSSKDGFGEAKIRTAAAEVAASFGELDGRLAGREWLSGADFGLADVCWIAVGHRLALMRYPFSRHPSLASWLGRARDRPSFERAVTAFEPRALRVAFAIYTRLRALGRSSISHYL